MKKAKYLIMMGIISAAMMAGCGSSGNETTSAAAETTAAAAETTAQETTAAPESSSEEAISAVDIFTDETSYMITNVNSTNVLEANSGEIADQWYDFGGIECRWYLKPAEDGSYYLINRMNEKRVAAVGTEDGTQVALEEPKDSAAERWFIEDAGDGSYTFCNAENKMYLSIEHDGDGNGNVAVQNKEKTASSTWTIEESRYQGEPEQPDGDPTGEASVALVRQELIAPNLIELAFDRDVKYATNTETYQVTVNGKDVTEFTIPCYFDNILSIRLPESIGDPENASIQVKICNQYVRDEKDNYLEDGKTYEVSWNPYYTKSYTSECGITIKGCDLVKDSTLKYAADVTDIMASKHPEIAEALVAAGADIALYPAEQNIYYIPEEREFYSPDALGVEGFGGTVELPTTALAAANVERDREHAMYPDTNVMAHEFGHAFHLIGIKTAAPALFDEIDATYEKVVLQEGKWANSYAGSNRDEYFGQLAALWFNGQAETQTWNGVLGPVNTRDELKEYDPESYALLEKIFPADKYFASPWAKEDTVDNFDINGNPRN